MPPTEIAAPTSPPADSPTVEQRAAISARDRDTFCEAAAGSGKTRVLVDRYCEALVSDGVAVDRVLAFTFTERAAAEMRGRVRRRLGEDARAAAEPALARDLRTLARATERAWVMTIHAFCRRLLAAYPLAAGLDPRFRVLDEAEAGRLRERAVGDALASVAATADEAMARALAAYRPYRIGDMTVEAHERLRSQGMTSPRLPEVLEPVRSSASDEKPEELDEADAEAAIAARSLLEAVLEAFGERYLELKRARSALDFGDLELEALRLLRENDAVAATWRGRFEHILVDEFQDTNRTQLALVEALRGPETRVFVVGDENQSIYRFRNADLEVFRAERRLAAERGTEMVRLGRSFRSSASVLGAVNELGAALLDGFEPLTGGSSVDAGPATELLLTVDERGKDAAKWSDWAEALEPPPSEKTPSLVAEARSLALRLRELVDAGKAERGDIVVLLRAFTHVDAYEDSLRRAGLEPYVVGGRGYWSQQQVEDVIRLLAVISNPLDDEMLFGALSSPAGGLSPDALWLLRQAAGENRHVWPVVEWRFGGGDRQPTEVDTSWLDVVPPADHARLERFCAILAGLRAAAAVTPLESLIDRAITAFDYDLALLERAGGAARMANVRKLMQLAREYERHEGRNLAGFLTAAQASTERDEREGMAAVRAEGHDGVRVMTIHAAKGLEFGVVAVPDLGRGLSQGHQDGDIVIAAAGEGQEARFGMRLAFPTRKSFGLWELTELHGEEKEAAAEEGCRLTYVGATRAQHRLILSGTFKEAQLAAGEPKPTDSPLRRLLPRLGALGFEGDDVELRLPGPTGGPSEVGLVVAVNRPSAERAEDLARRFPASPRPAPSETREGNLIEGLPRPTPVGHLSYSALSDYERCGYRFYAERVLGLSEPVEPGAGKESGANAGALAFGSAVHAVLEWSARNGWAEPAPELIGDRLAAQGGDPDQAGRALDLVRGWLACDLARELSGLPSRAEVPFVLDLAGSVVRGKIDLLVDSPRGPVVVDFKTDALEGGSAAELGGRYQAQRELYALVAASGAGAGRPVRAVHLFLQDPASPVAEELGPLELEAVRARLEGLIGLIKGGDFAPTASPTAAICFGCPAAANLCPHPAWRPAA
jgi:ATP-dependent exoDNAse (exonuclease V) beta subunit